MTNPMKIVELNKSFEKAFWKYVYSDPVDNYFFVYDYKQNREKSRFYGVMDDAKELVGIGLNYDSRVVQFRGTEAAIRIMAEGLETGNAYIQVPVEYEQILPVKYSSGGASKFQVTLMSITRGQEKVKISTVPSKLKVEEAAEISDLISQTNFEMWTGTVEQVKSRFVDSTWLGIREKGKLVSIGAARLNDYGSLIGPIATLTPFRKRGYATSIVSTFVAESLRIPSTPMISVRKDNLTALNVYSSIGFEPQKSYFLIRPSET